MSDKYYMTKKICKADIVEQIHQTTNLPKKDISLVLDSFFSEVKEGLCSGSVIELRNFGTFEPRLRKGKANSRNPKTGEKVKAEPHYIAAFRPGSELKEKIWKIKI